MQSSESPGGLGLSSTVRCSPAALGHGAPTILLSAKAEVEQAGFERPSPVASIIFCEKLKKGLEQLTNRGVLTGLIQDGGDTQFFEIRDTEGNVIESATNLKTSAWTILGIWRLFRR